MHEPVQYAVALVEAPDERPHDRGVPPLVEQKCPVRDRVRYLQESCLPRLGEVGDVAQVVDRSPTSAQLAKAPDPDPRPLLVRALGEDDQSSLWVVVFLVSFRQKDVEATTDLLGRMLDRLFAVQALVLLYDPSLGSSGLPDSSR
jgi:hypothetical protein